MLKIENRVCAALDKTRGKSWSIYSDYDEDGNSAIVWDGMKQEPQVVPEWVLYGIAKHYVGDQKHD